MCEHFTAPLRSFLLQRIAFGSYPEVVLSDDPRRLLRDLSSDYLWKDILQTGLVKTPDLIRRAGSAAFQSVYGVPVKPIGPANPFVADLLDTHTG